MAYKNALNSPQYHQYIRETEAAGTTTDWRRKCIIDLDLSLILIAEHLC
jgi:hypothetical protein